MANKEQHAKTLLELAAFYRRSMAVSAPRDYVPSAAELIREREQSQAVPEALEAGAAALQSPAWMPIEQLVEQWRRNADMLAEGNKNEWPSEGAGMQRACADQLEQLLRQFPQVSA